MYRAFGMMLIITGIPLALRLVPRNPIYGYRTRETLAADETWYRANVRAGLALIAGGVWLFGLPRLQPAISLNFAAVVADAYLLLPLAAAIVVVRSVTRRRHALK